MRDRPYIWLKIKRETHPQKSHRRIFSKRVDELAHVLAVTVRALRQPEVLQVRIIVADALDKRSHGLNAAIYDVIAFNTKLPGFVTFCFTTIFGAVVRSGCVRIMT